MSVLGTWTTTYPRADTSKLIATATPVSGVVAGDITLGAGQAQAYNTSANINVDGLGAEGIAGDATTAIAYTNGHTWKTTLTIPAGKTVSALRFKYAGGIQTGSATVTAVYINGSNVSGDVTLQPVSTYNGAAVNIDLSSAGSFTSDALIAVVHAPRAAFYQLGTFGHITGGGTDLELSGTVTTGSGFNPGWAARATSGIAGSGVQ